MSGKKRGRPKENSLRYELPRLARADHIDSLARKLGAKAAAKQLGMSVRRVQQIRKYSREHVERIRREARRIAHMGRAPDDMDRKFAIVGKLLATSTFDQLLELDFGAGREIMDRLVDGAEARERVAALEADVRRLQTRLAAAEATNPFSAKRNSR